MIENRTVAVHKRTLVRFRICCSCVYKGLLLKPHGSFHDKRQQSGMKKTVIFANYSAKTSNIVQTQINRFRQLKCCVLIPTYNNASTVEKIVKTALQHTPDVIVVNDGSTDGTDVILEAVPQITLIGYTKNKGKGHALKLGFQKAISLGFRYAITIDSDGQHNPDELPLFLDKLAAQPERLIIGQRHFKRIEHLPAKNSFANHFSNFWFRLQTGIDLADTQSGYRLYPLSLFENRRYYSRKFEFELEVLVRATWQGFPLETIPIVAHYPPNEERVTHFRPVQDFLRISLMHTILTTLAIVYFIPRRYYRKFRHKKMRDIIRNDIISNQTPNGLIAASIGFGVFMGIVPIWGYQLVVGLFLAHLFKLNKAVFFLAANISIPPFIPFILYLSYVTGSFVLGEGSWYVSFDLDLASIPANLKQYLVGSVVLAIMAGVFAGLLAYVILPMIKSRKA